MAKVITTDYVDSWKSYISRLIVNNLGLTYFGVR